MRNDSSQNYNTKYSKVQNFRDFEENIRKEKDKLKKIKRGFKVNKDGSSNLSNVEDKLKYNKITHKTDGNFGKDQITDFIGELDDTVKDTDHKYTLQKSQNKVFMESYTEFTNTMLTKDNDFSDYSDVTSYMFFGNLQTIHRLSTQILQMDEQQVNKLLDEGHNWAEDHITTAKVQISQVYNFLTNKSLKEQKEYNYMFFSNLETICDQCKQILEFDEIKVDNILRNGHDWAEDHISSAKENIEQVHDWLENEFN